jgi:hypothetical protein
MTGSMAVFVSIVADIFADLGRRFMRIGQKVKEYSAPSEVGILPIFLPITRARGVGQVRGVRTLLAPIVRGIKEMGPKF